MTQRIITFANGEAHIVEVIHYPAQGRRPERYEVEVEEGISTGAADVYGDNPTYAWIFPCGSIEQAVSEFVGKVEQEREETGYYRVTGAK